MIVFTKARRTTDIARSCTAKRNGQTHDSGGVVRSALQNVQRPGLLMLDNLIDGLNGAAGYAERVKRLQPVRGRLPRKLGLEQVDQGLAVTDAGTVVGKT